MPGGVVPSLPGSPGPEALDLDTYKILTSHKFAADRREVSSLLSVRSSSLQELPESQKPDFEKGELLEVQGTGAPYPGR